MHRYCFLSACLAGATAMAQSWTTTVVAAQLPSSPSARLVYDDARQRLVSSEPGEPMWEFDGSAWARRDLALPAGVMLYDPTRERTLLVGPGGLLAYDGETATTIGPAFSARDVVADTVRGRLVAVTTAPTLPGFQLWEFDGSSFTQVAQRSGNFFVNGAEFDPVRGTTVLSIVQYQAAIPSQLWEWDGTNLLGPLTPGVPLTVIGFEAGSQQMLLGGSSGVYRWNGAALTQVNSNWEDQYGLHCVDSRNGRLLRSWGNTIWQWNGTSWLDLDASPIPQFFPAVLTHDANRNRTVLLGMSGSPRHAEWDGVAWRSVPPSPNSPPTFYRHAQAYHAAFGETVVFGGSLGSTGFGPVVGTTYAWNGTTWRLAATTGPAPRRSAAMTYDAARQRVVLYGGRDPATQAYFDDHWEWDGVAWTQIASSTPFGGWAAVLGFDPVRQRVVGYDLQRRIGEYDGTAWTVLTPVGPLLAYGPDSSDPSWNLASVPTFAWHGASQRLVLNGLQFGSPAAFGWNGVDWQAMPLLAGLHSEVGAAGSLLAVSYLTQLASTRTAASTRFGLGCGGNTTATSLATFGRPVLGSTQFQLDLRAEARQAIAAFGFGDAAISTPIGNGCTLLVGGLFAVEVRLTDLSGFARLPLAVPASPALTGATLVTQGLVFDPLSPGGLALTQGRTLTLGE